MIFSSDVSDRQWVVEKNEHSDYGWKFRKKSLFSPVGRCLRATRSDFAFWFCTCRRKHPVQNCIIASPGRVVWLGYYPSIHMNHERNEKCIGFETDVLLYVFTYYTCAPCTRSFPQRPFRRFPNFFSRKMSAKLQKDNEIINRRRNKKGIVYSSRLSYILDEIEFFIIYFRFWVKGNIINVIFILHRDVFFFFVICSIFCLRKRLGT